MPTSQKPGLPKGHVREVLSLQREKSRDSVSAIGDATDLQMLCFAIWRIGKIARGGEI
jgi:hypothetical protein